jgi:hypothetical protein
VDPYAGPLDRTVEMPLTTTIHKKPYIAIVWSRRNRGARVLPRATSISRSRETPSARTSSSCHAKESTTSNQLVPFNNHTLKPLSADQLLVRQAELKLGERQLEVVDGKAQVQGHLENLANGSWYPDVVRTGIYTIEVARLLVWANLFRSTPVRYRGRPPIV